MSVPRDRLQREDRHRAEVHDVLRPPAERDAARLREGLPDRVDQVRLSRRPPGRRGQAARGAPNRWLQVRPALRPRYDGVRRAQRVLPVDGHARDVRPSERGERHAAEPQQRARLPRRCGHRDRRPRRGRARVPQLAHERNAGRQALMPEHFAAPPNWGFWILAYFFFGGIAGGSYAIGTLVRLVGPEDQRLSRTAFIVSFLALIPCPLFLIADLGVPSRFLNLLIDASEGGL